MNHPFLVTVAVFFLAALPLLQCYSQGELEPQLGTAGRPNYEIYRMDDIASQGEPGYSGDLSLSIPLLTVPGRHGHDFAIRINYSGAITQRQEASWVGLGWSLDLGAVERSVIGRSDDQQNRLGSDFNLGPDNSANREDGTPHRAEKVGFLNPAHKDLSDNDKDQCDMYSLVIDGGSQSLLPVALDEQGLYRQFPFATTPYKPWWIEAIWNYTSAPIEQFRVIKEGGERYTFGIEGSSGAIDETHLFGRTSSGAYLQKFFFPYRWSLASIYYPDGSATTIKYNNHNHWPSVVTRPYASVPIDRSYAWQANLFGAGFTDYQHMEDSIRYSYSCPETLFTDTHFLVFRSSTPNEGERTARNRRLDSLILYERASGLELQRVTFEYAPTDNPNTFSNYTTPEWTATEPARLKDNQLTLLKITIKHSPGGPALPSYSFTYTKNPNVDLYLMTILSAQGEIEYPGYETPDYPGGNPDYAVAWRLKSMTLPTGGRIEYAFEALSGYRGAGYCVKWNPEGDSASAPNGQAFSYRAEPTCRVVEKRVSDPLGPTQVWGFRYGEAIYDPPTRPQYSSYRPRATFWDPAGFILPENYYQVYRSCSIGHRWVETTLPDGSTKTAYYTSSYKGANADPRESQPDYISGSSSDRLLMISRHGMRGLIWKTASPAETTLTYYEMTPIDTTTDLYKYEYVTSLNYLQYVKYVALRVEPVRSVTTRDGITDSTMFCYNRTPLERYIEGLPWQSGDPYTFNGMLSSKMQEGNAGVMTTAYSYACGYYQGMDDLHMLSQPYATTVSFNSKDESKVWTTYEPVSGVWLPSRTYAWNAHPSEGRAPYTLNPSDGQIIQVQSVSYDASGYGDIVSATDANGNWTKYYYSADTLNSFSTSAAGLGQGRVSGVERLRSSGPGFFTLLSPVNGTNGGLSGTLTWSPSSNVVSYDVFLGTSNPPTTLLAGNLTGTSCPYAGLNTNQVYYWTVVAKNGDGETEAINAPMSFLASPLPLPFDLVSPADGSEVTRAGVNLVWHRARQATSYDVYVGPTDADILWASGLTDTVSVFDDVSLGSNFWKVVAKNGYGETISNDPPWFFWKNNSLSVGETPQVQDSSLSAYAETQGATTQTSSSGLTSAGESTSLSSLSLSLLEGESVPDVLRTSFVYDQFGNITLSVTENADTTRYFYDPLGRLERAVGPSGQVIGRFAYGYNLSFQNLTPNQILATTFRSGTDSSVSALYYDGLGYESQRQTRLGSMDIISHTIYDAMRRKACVYKSYDYSLPQQHTYDTSYQAHASTYYPSAGSYPYIRSEYMLDGTGRLRHSHAPGTLFQDEAQGRFVSSEYGHGALGVSQGAGPSSVPDADPEWQPNTGTLLSALQDPSGPNDATYARLAFPAGVNVSASLLAQIGSIPGSPDPSGYYAVKFRCRRQTGGGTLAAGVDGGVGILELAHPWLTVALIDGGITKGQSTINWSDMLDGFGTFQCLVPVKDISNPGNLSVDISGGGQEDGGGYIDVSWLRVETYYPEFQSVTSRDENGVRQRSYRDALGNTIASVVDPDNLALMTRFEYDASGKPLKVTNPKGQVSTYSYNKRHFLTEKQSPDAGSVRYRYDRAGNARFSQDAAQASAGKCTYQKFDRLNRVVEIGECTGSFWAFDSTSGGSPSLDAPTSSVTLIRKNFYDAPCGSYPSARKLLGRLSCAISLTQGVADSTFYSYEEFGRIEWIVQKLAGLSPKKIAYRYDWQGDVTQIDYSDPGDLANALSFFFEYDAAGRLFRVYSSQDPNGSAKVKEAEYTYNANGQVKRLQLGLAQGLDYRYNERDWLTNINDDTLSAAADPGHDGSNGLPTDRFGSVLGYYDSTGIGAAQHSLKQYNGNVSWMMYNTSGLTYNGTPLVGFSYAYDRANRLLSADFGYYTSAWLGTNSYDLTMSYDNNGNITGLQRHGAPNQPEPVQDLGYIYGPGTNRSTQIYDDVPQAVHDYSFDANGNVVSDQWRGISGVTYDYRNLPIQATVSGQTMKFRYDGSGSRIYKERGASKSYYIRGADGETIAVYDQSGTLLYWNILAGGKVIGKITR